MRENRTPGRCTPAGALHVRVPYSPSELPCLRCPAPPGLAWPRHALPRRACVAQPCQAQPCHASPALPSLAVPCRAAPRPDTPSRASVALRCQAQPRRATPSHAMPALPGLAAPRLARPRRAMPTDSYPDFRTFSIARNTGLSSASRSYFNRHDSASRSACANNSLHSFGQRNTSPVWR